MAPRCCCRKTASNAVEPFGDSGEEQDNSPMATQRQCRDLLCTLIFVAFWGGMLFIGFLGYQNGKPERLLYGTDFMGDTCGQGNRASEKLVYFPRMNQDLNEAVLVGKSPMDVQFFGVCVAACPAAGTYVCDYSKTKVANPESYVDEYGDRGPCWYVPLKSSNIFFRCLPLEGIASNSTIACKKPGGGYRTPQADPKYFGADGKPNKNCKIQEVTTTTVVEKPGQPNPLIEQSQKSLARLLRWAGDIQVTLLWSLLISGGGGMVLGFIWLLLLKYFAREMVWFICFAVVLVMAGLSAVLCFKGGLVGSGELANLATKVASSSTLAPPSPDLTKQQEDQKMYEIAAYIMCAATVIVVVLIIFMKKKLRIAIGIIREASEALRQAPMLVVFPIIPFVLLLVVVGYWMVAGAYISSMASFSLGDLQGAIGTNSSNANSTMTTMNPDDLSQFFITYHFFGLLWTNQLIQAISMCTIAGVVCQYYWSRQKTGLSCGGVKRIARSFANCFRYHFGSLVFGAAVIAIIQFLRAVLAYIDKNTKHMQDKNRVLKIAMKLLQCCMWCLEKCMKFVSRNAFILVAMKGRGFVASTIEAFWLILHNLAQIAVTASISTFLLVLAKLTIAIVCGAAMYLVIETDPAYSLHGSKELSSPGVPVVFSVLLGWCVACTFMSVYELAIDTILLCFCVDLKEHKEGGYYMSEELMSVLGVTSKSSKKPDASFMGW